MGPSGDLTWNDPLELLLQILSFPLLQFLAEVENTTLNTEK